MKGKSLVVIGLIISIIFSILGYIFALLLKDSLGDQDFIDSLRDLYIESGESEEMTQSAIESIGNIANGLIVIAIVFGIIGLISLIAMFYVNQNNKKKMGILIIVVSVLHLFTFRLLAFVLLLIGGIQLTKDYEEIQPPKRGDEFFNELGN